MPGPATHRDRIYLYIRLILAAGLAGIAVGYYFQVIGRLEMTPFNIFSFTVRGMIIGAFFWFFEIFWVHGPRGRKLRALSYGARLAVKVVVYVVLIETGFIIGYALFNPCEIAALLLTGESR